MDRFVSIVMCHYSANDERSDTMQRSILSLIENTEYPYQLIVVDNGGSKADTRFLQDLANIGKITNYIKNSTNMHFGYARNQGIALSEGDYIAIVDDDIFYKRGWLKKLVNILEAFPEEKYYATYFDYPMPFGKIKYRIGEFMHNGEKYILNTGAGSNCFLIERSKFLDIGLFEAHIVAGSKWTNKAIETGYSAVVVPGGLTEDMGLRKGYNFHKLVPICMELSNGDKVYFNTDAFIKEDNLPRRFQKINEYIRSRS